MDAQTQIINLLKAKVPSTQIAKAVGVDESYVAQIKATISTEISEQTIALDKKYDNMEDKLADKLQEVINSGLLLKPNELLNAITKINGLKRRSLERAENLNGPSISNNVVIVTLPEKIVSSYRVNPQNEVIEVGNRSLITMSNNSVMAELKKRTATMQELEL